MKNYTLEIIFTFLGEKILGIFAGHYEFAWDTPQQLNDQRYMVYRDNSFQEERGRQTRQTDCQTVSSLQAHSGYVGGGLKREQLWWQQTHCICSSESDHEALPRDIIFFGIWNLYSQCETKEIKLNKLIKL